LILELVVTSTACRRHNSRIDFVDGGVGTGSGFGLARRVVAAALRLGLLILELFTRHAVDVTTNSRINFLRGGVAML
jgi:hypothetical protein